jgi:hypothetical protein
MCLFSCHWILAMICLNMGSIFILDALDIDKASYKEFINCTKW